ncbi:MAG: hypothetical protein JNJ82_09855 [Opitutaceae bacterium]|nr:hypothetical protein [Opitutaceae bacterium]
MKLRSHIGRARAPKSRRFSMQGRWRSIGGAALLLTVLATASTGAAAERMPLLMPDDFDSFQLVSWRVEPGVPDPRNPLLEPAMPWDAGGIMAHGTVLRDPIDGVWKAWQVSTPAEETFEGLTPQHEHQRRLTYLESRDGVTWYRPALPFVRWPGHESTNILLDLDSGGTSVYASVLVDPANREWPYEMFVMRGPLYGGQKENKVGHLPGPTERLATYRYRARDGKAWQLVEGPIHASVGGGADVSYVYRDDAGGYYSYFKTYPGLRAGDRLIPYDNNPRGGLRSVARRTSPDGSVWSGEQIVLARDWRDPDYAQFLEVCPVRVEGGYVALVNAYDAVIQTMCLQLAASRDGVHWWRPDRRPALPNAPLGDYGGGMIWQMHHPVVEGGAMHVYYAGSEGIHGEVLDSRLRPQIVVGGEKVGSVQKPTLPFNTALCRATWDFDRLWALAASAGGATRGSAVTRPLALAGKVLALNVRVKPGGVLRAELLDREDRPVPGFSANDCTPVTGDHRRTAVAWQGGMVAPAAAAKVRFILQRAFLYGYALDSGEHR